MKEEGRDTQLPQKSFRHSLQLTKKGQNGLISQLTIYYTKSIHIFLQNPKKIYLVHYQKKINSSFLTPLAHFFNLSSIQRERYSGDLLLMFRTYSKSKAIICLQNLSLENEFDKKQSVNCFISNSLWKKRSKPLLVIKNSKLC